MRTETVLLANGIDTLFIGFHGRLRTELLDKLEELKGQVMPGREPILELEGRRMAVMATGRPFYAYGIRDANIIVFISRVAGDHPPIYVHMLSEYLWHVGPDQAVEETRAWVGQALCEDGVEAEAVSRVDLTADFDGELPWQLELVVSRARERDVRFVGDVPSGLNAGRGAIRVRVYDKVREMESNPAKSFFWAVWHRAPGSLEQVVRVEYQLRREALREFGLETWDQVRERLADLWQYLVTDWFSLRLNDAERQDRRTMHPFWQRVQAVSKWIMAGFGKIVRNRSARGRYEDAFRTARGYLTSLAAYLVRPSGAPNPQQVAEQLAASWGPDDWLEAVGRKWAVRMVAGASAA